MGAPNLKLRHYRIMRALKDRPRDVYDIADLVGRRWDSVYEDCLELRAWGALSFMYPEDEMSLTAQYMSKVPSP